MQYFFIVILLTLLSTQTYAQYYQNLTIANSRALALGNAVTADPPGLDSVHYNPAGLYRAVEGKSRVELHLVYGPTPTFEFDTQWTGEYPDTNLPNFGCDTQCLLENPEPLETQTYKVSEFNSYTPYSGKSSASSLLPRGGAGTHVDAWDAVVGSATYVALRSGYALEQGAPGSFPRRESSTVDIVLAAPGFAKKVTNNLTLGFSIPLHYYGTEIVTSLRIPNLYLSLVSDVIESLCQDPFSVEACADDGSSLPTYDQLLEVQFEAEDKITPSINLGFLWEPLPWLTVGGVYQSEVRHELKGDFEITYDDSLQKIIETGLLNILPNSPNELSANGTDVGEVTISQVLPEHFSLGVSLKVTPKLKMNIDYKKTQFSEWQDFVLEFDRPTYLSAITGLVSGGPENSSSTPRGFANGSNWALGFEYQLRDALKLRFGYEYRPNTIPKENRTFAFPLGSTKILATGVGYNLPGRFDVDFVYAKIDSKQNIPVGSSYVTEWNPTEIYAAYPGYNLENRISIQMAILAVGYNW